MRESDRQYFRHAYYCENVFSPVLDQPVVSAILISTISYYQHSVVEIVIRAGRLVVHPSLIKLRETEDKN